MVGRRQSRHTGGPDHDVAVTTILYQVLKSTSQDSNIHTAKNIRAILQHDSCPTRADSALKLFSPILPSTLTCGPRLAPCREESSPRKTYRTIDNHQQYFEANLRSMVLLPEIWDHHILGIAHSSRTRPKRGSHALRPDPCRLHIPT